MKQQDIPDNIAKRVACPTCRAEFDIASSRNGAGAPWNVAFLDMTNSHQIDLVALDKGDVKIIHVNTGNPVQEHVGSDGGNLIR